MGPSFWAQHHAPYPGNYYTVLGLTRDATQDEIKQAYRRLARTTHPDKGGSTQAFAALQAAFETLSDPKARAAYDSLGADLRFRQGAAKPYHHHSQHTSDSSSSSGSGQQADGSSAGGPPPGVTEAVLLQQLLQRGAQHPHAVFDPRTQLCVTCEVCTRPATQQCWTCGMDICDFCTRRQHWKGAVSLHWPLVNQPGSMLEQLGRRELDLKRREDGQAFKEAQPDYRPQSELQVLRQFQDAVVDILQQQQQQQQQKKKKSVVGGLVTTHATNPASTNSSSSNGSSIGSHMPAGAHPTGPAAPFSDLLTNSSSSSSTAAIQQQPSGDNAVRASAAQTLSPSAHSQPSAFALSRGTLLPHSSTSTITTSSSSRVVSTGAAALMALPSSSSSSSSACTLSVAAPSTGSCCSRSLSSLSVGSNRSVKAPQQKCWQAWQGAPEAVRQSLLGLHDNRLSRFYMWAQTECSVLLALHLPTGGGKVPPKLTVTPTPSTLLVQHQGFAPLLNRAWANPVDTSAGVSSWESQGGQLLVLQVCKGQPGRMWTSCFKGDPHLARHLQSPYHLVQTPSEVQLEVPLPFWVHPTEDVQVVIGPRQLTVDVDGFLRLHRTYCSSTQKQRGDCQVVEPSRSSWCLLEEGSSEPSSNTSGTQQQPPTSGAAAGKPLVPAALSNTYSCSSSSSSCGVIRRTDKTLVITLALPDPTEEEVLYKKGVRQNNASVVRGCLNGAGKSGMAFFTEDEDEVGLTAVLQAVLFQETGCTWLVPKPWELATGSGGLMGCTNSSRSRSSSSSSNSSNGGQPGRTGGLFVAPGSGRWVQQEAALPAEVAAHLKWLRAAAAAAAASEAGSAAEGDAEGGGADN